MGWKGTWKKEMKYRRMKERKNRGEGQVLI
jgi:hypothetical protein